LGLDPDCFWIGKVARFGETKRHRDLIGAFECAILQEPRLRLLLVGDGGLEKQTVLNQIAESPARDHIRWAGFQQEPVPWYQAMDALVVASSFEGLPNAVLEGMACGLPLLANDVCGVREVAEAGKHGWIEDLSTVERLAAGLVKIAQADKAELHRMGAAASAHVRERFSMEAMLKKYDQLYTSVAGGSETNLETPTHHEPI
jgi:glycosyltransferase involved in cell wall biosynthesis